MAVGNQTPASVASEYAALLFVIRQLMGGMGTATIVRVVACTNSGGLVPVGTVDAQPLVNLMTGERISVPHGVLYKLPYTRIQGGANAVIVDPEPGDLGIAIFASRDISAVKAAKAAANPGSERQFSYADGMYIGGLLNGTPEQYVQLNAAGVKVFSPTAITLEAPTINLKGDVVQTAGNVTMSQDLDVAGTITGDVDVFAGNISGKTHTHGGVTTGGDDTAVPNP